MKIVIIKKKYFFFNLKRSRAEGLSIQLIVTVFLKLIVYIIPIAYLSVFVVSV